MLELKSCLDAVACHLSYEQAVAKHRVNGKIVSDLCSDIQEMKRLGKHGDAADLLYKICIADIQIFKDSGFHRVRSWAFDQLRICLKKAGRAEEVHQVLSAYEFACNALGSEKDASLMQCLAKARHQ